MVVLDNQEGPVLAVGFGQTQDGDNPGRGFKDQNGPNPAAKTETQQKGPDMAMTTPPITSDEASKAMLNGLTNLIRDKLRERIMASIKSDIDAAVEEALASFKTTIESYREPEYMRDTVRVMIENKIKQ